MNGISRKNVHTHSTNTNNNNENKNGNGRYNTATINGSSDDIAISLVLSLDYTTSHASIRKAFF